MLKKIAITGGIGSGKSFLCNIFKTLQIPIFDSDAQAKELMVNDKKLILELKKEFGDDIYLPNDDINQTDTLNKSKLADIVFTDKDALKRLNSLVHPAVRNKFNEWCEMCENNLNPPYVLFESAIIFESGLSEIFDKIITVTADLEVRIERAIKRNDTIRVKVLERIKNQKPDEYKIANSDYIITTNKVGLEESYLNLIPQVFEIHSDIIRPRGDYESDCPYGDYVSGKPQGMCTGDGHYLCGNCKHYNLWDEISKKRSKKSNKTRQ